MSEKPVGLTKDVGFQVGARRTFPISVRQAWELLTENRGVKLWLGDLDEIHAGTEYQLDDGTTGVMRVFKPESHLRITWQPSTWPKASTIQVRVLPKDSRCVIVFHQENMPDAAARKERLEFYKKALDEIENLIKK